jgi:hypothetical protein
VAGPRGDLGCATSELSHWETPAWGGRTGGQP